MTELYFWFARKLVSLRNEEGATAVEYGIMVALIAIVIIAAVTLVGTNLRTVFNDVAATLIGLAGQPVVP